MTTRSITCTETIPMLVDRMRLLEALR